MKDFQKSATWDAEHRLLFCTSTGFITCTWLKDKRCWDSLPVHLLILTSCCNLLQATQSPLFHWHHTAALPRTKTKGFQARTAHSWIFTMFFLIHFCQSIYHDSTGFISLCQSTCRYLHLVHLRQVHQQQAKSTSKCRSKSSLSKPFKEASLQ